MRWQCNPQIQMCVYLACLACFHVKKSRILCTSVLHTYPPLARMRRNWRTMRATADIRSRNCLAGPGKCHRGCRICCPPPIVAPHHHQSNVANFCCPKTFSPPVPISITNDAFPSRPIFQDFCKSYFSTWQHDSCLNRSNLIPQIVLTQLLILLADRNSKTKPSFIIPRYVIHLSYLCLPEAYILHQDWSRLSSNFAFANSKNFLLLKMLNSNYFSCDKYWHCQDGFAELKTCGNGLGFLDTDDTFTLEQVHILFCMLNC